MANQTPPPQQQWILAATAILTTLTRRQPRYDLLGGAPAGPDAVNTAKTILANSWGIDTREKLEGTIESLLSAGHTADYQKAASAFQQAPPDQRQADPKLAFVGQYGAQIGNKGLLAWDIGRLFAVAGWGFLAGYCNDVEAWGVSMQGATKLQSTYGSWDEYADHYRLGAMFGNPEAVAQIDPIIAQLRSAPDSPWKRIPWRLDGAAAVGPTGMSLGTPGPQYGPAPGASPYGMAPAGGAPMAGPPGAAPVAGTKKKSTGLIVGIAVGGVLFLGIAGGLVYHFTHESEHPHEHEHDHGGGQHPHGGGKR